MSTTPMETSSNTLTLDSLASLIIPDSGAEFHGDDVRKFNKPCVYVYLRELEPLYVGMSRKGLQRVFASNHSQAALAREQCTKLLVYFCETEDRAMECEGLLISALKPRYNQRRYRFALAKIMGITAQQAKTY